MRPNIIYAVVLGLLALVAQTDAIDDKCGACAVVANALFRRVDAELPKNALDMRHRLDKDGNRWGKVIDYKLSELRMDALLSSLCDVELKDYAWIKSDQQGAGGRWSQGRQKGLEGAERAKQDQWNKELVGYCHNILETHEDDVITAIRGDQGSGDVTRSRMCINLGICSASALDVKEEL